MALYIKPPRGKIEYNKLCYYVKKRLIFLTFVRGKSREEITHGIKQEILASCSECLIEGSLLDRISHFVIRLLCSIDAEMCNFFIESETNLFIYRLEFYELSDIRRMMENAKKKCLEICTFPFVIKSYKSILTSLIRIAGDLSSDVEKQYVKAPFTAALKFVEKRLFSLKSGFVEVPLESLKHLLTVVFEELLVQGLNQIRASNCMLELNDPRMKSMHKEIQHLFKANVTTFVPVSNSIILEENLNQESDNFPLCMANLHNLLRNNHRLQHTSRVQYILYLKEIGVPCQEVINLFMKEYSLPVVKKKTSTKICDHSWVENQNRYIYSIEHLYGKRGSRKNYEAHSCNALQTSGNSSDGGCPYACFDEKNLKKVLSSCSFKVKDIEDIISLSSTKNYAKACHYNFLLKMEKDASEIHVNKERINSHHFKILSNPKNYCCPSEKCDASTTASVFDSCRQLSLDKFLFKLYKPSDFYFFIKNLDLIAVDK